jgi:hypothetical protein
MDGDRFDAVTKLLVTGLTRRRVLRGLAGSAAAAALAVLGRTPAGAAPKPKTCKVGCSGLNRQAKVACEKACKACGGDFDRVCFEDGPFGPTSIVCCPEGTFCVGGTGLCCEEGTEPCFGPEGATCCPTGTFCNFDLGECQELTTCPTGEPAENCFAGVETSCNPDGFCALADDADGDDCLCVERVCTDVPCATDADCAESGGVCATIPGCCPDATFCALPCGSAGARRAGGWQR